jgi:hypothetical protein
MIFYLFIALTDNLGRLFLFVLLLLLNCSAVDSANRPFLYFIMVRTISATIASTERMKISA